MRSDDTSAPAERTSAAQAGLTIHALSAGGGILALCRLPGGGGDYRSDLIQIYQWKPGLVISMTTEAEHAAAGVPRLGVDIQSMACRWLHLPVPDFQAPPPAVTAKWAAASQSARQALAGGGRVLVHCKGGCGRSGMAVLRLMIECGEDPAQALARLRAVRPCAVETDEQLAWACSP
ncbi:dual specificity protein phosphatase family protein [Leisingera daeponensis]|uniref:Dual specificity protein phosphatase family protein n=1 Tax=Leisingera daeponensis TaxID=405746 RepID=A0ABS7NHU6_9RHOB|nr:protein-tyrosine phosphatase family protein [Leisingera daeponensis]MBY6058439.1 dual specificity protein phosphatase family protein [Leisingera daeponensis]MBY6140794.1 dual specificity protein phosphatase family protein [Leisingera daeponensis]